MCLLRSSPYVCVCVCVCVRGITVQEKLEKERNLMTAKLVEEEGKRDSMAKVIQVAETKCAELANADETLEDLLSQLQPLVTNCRSKLKPSNHTER